MGEGGAVGVEGADVEAGAGHVVGAEVGEGDEMTGEGAGGVGVATGIDGGADEGEVGAGVEVEGRDGPFADGFGGFFLHEGDSSCWVDLDDACALEPLEPGLMVAHD